MHKNYSKQLVMTSVIFSVLLMSGCGTFDLGMVYPVSGQSAAQRDGDMAICKVKAYEAANSKERQAGNFIAGLTIIGTPVAIEEDKKLQRRIFKECLEEKGYVVEPPKEKQVAAGANTTASTSNNKQNPSPTKSDEKPRILVPLGDEWVDTTITDELKKSGAIIYKINHSVDAGLMVSRVKTSYIKDPSKYVETTKSYLQSLLKNSQKSDTKIIEINGTQYAQYELWGTLLNNGTNIEIKYLSYMAVDKEEIFVIRFWTQIHNYDFQKSTFEEKMNGVVIRDPQRVLAAVRQERSNLTASQIKQQCKNLGFSEGSEDYSVCLAEILSREK
jgi:hypothetical protein